MQRLFISYSSDDRSFVETEIVPLLKRNALRPWCADQDIRASANWQRTIRQELSTSDWVLVVLSPSSVRSDWVQAETDLAFKMKQDRIIPLLYRDCDPTELHIKLGLLQYLDCRAGLPADKVLLEVLWAQEGQRSARGEAGPSGGRASGKDDTHVVARESVVVELTIDMPYANFTGECQSALAKGIRDLLGVDDFIIRTKRKGSTRLILELSRAKAEQLCREIKAKRLWELSVTDARILTDLESQQYLVSEVVEEHAFRELIARRIQTLLAFADYLARSQPRDVPVTRPFLADLLSQAVQLEEFLDAYGAEKNSRWCGFRQLTASLRVLAEVGYELVYIRHEIPAYRSLSVEPDFCAATDEAIEYAISLLILAAQKILATAQELQVGSSSVEGMGNVLMEHLPPGHLSYDREFRRDADAVGETAALLATTFLNLASESETVRAASRTGPKDYALCMDAPLSEETLRKLESQFHNLQSRYDARFSNATAEQADSDLLCLRGHISVVLHLLRVAKLFVHYYERHVREWVQAKPWASKPLVEPDALLSMLINYSVAFIDHYIGSAIPLCQNILVRYVEVGRIQVPIPQYRGFHVRPATLVSKLVLYYGSKVQMLLGDEVYDASSPLELFRANEKINAWKRRSLAREIVRLGLVPEDQSSTDLPSVVRSVVNALVTKGKVILHEQPLELPESLCRIEGTLVEKVVNEMGRLLAMGKIDVVTDMVVEFVGDKRVLADIKHLAELGYGEDALGNNVALSKELTHLRR